MVKIALKHSNFMAFSSTNAESMAMFQGMNNIHFNLSLDINTVLIINERNT